MKVVMLIEPKKLFGSTEIFLKSQSPWNKFKRLLEKNGWPSYGENPVTICSNFGYVIKVYHTYLLSPIDIAKRAFYKNRDEEIKRELLLRLEKP